jgi:hypothetical protein
MSDKKKAWCGVCSIMFCEVCHVFTAKSVSMKILQSGGVWLARGC